MTRLFITDSDFSGTDKTFEYLLGFQPSLGAIILTNTQITILLDSRYFLNLEKINEKILKNKLGIENIKKINCSNILESIVSELKDYKEIYLENNIAIKYYQYIKNNLKNIKIKLSENYFLEKRQIKNNKEAKNIKTAIKNIDKVFLYIKKLSDSKNIIGKTEKEIQNIIIKKILEYSSEKESFNPIVAFGPNSSIPHHTPGNTKLINGVLLIDMGAICNGYCSDFTRTFWVGEKNSNYKYFLEIYEIVKQAHLESIKNFKIGMSGKNLDKISRDYIRNKGYGKYYTHSLGHGIGLDVHEEPKISRYGDKKLKNGMVFTIEPGIYLPGKFGIRLEDIVFLEDDKLKKYSKIEI